MQRIFVPMQDFGAALATGRSSRTRIAPDAPNAVKTGANRTVSALDAIVGPKVARDARERAVDLRHLALGQPPGLVRATGTRVVARPACRVDVVAVVGDSAASRSAAKAATTSVSDSG